MTSLETTVTRKLSLCRCAFCLMWLLLVFDVSSAAPLVDSTHEIMTDSGDYDDDDDHHHHNGQANNNNNNNNHFGPPPVIKAQSLDLFIRLATSYLVRICHTQAQDYGNAGKFEYVTHLNHERLKVSRFQSNYNLLRHNGAIYAMGQAYERGIVGKSNEGGDLWAAMTRATKYLQDKAIHPVPVGVEDNDHDDTHGDLLSTFTEWIPNALAAWETKAISPKVQTPTAKLGGSGLALIALTTMYRLADPPDSPPQNNHNHNNQRITDLEEMRQLATFIEYLQHEDTGAFTSRYKPALGGKDDSWVSLYYPGEACLGLVNLASLETDDTYKDRWIRVAVKALLYLEGMRQHEPLSRIQPDHWALLATAQLLPMISKDDGGGHTNSYHASYQLECERIYRHAIQVVRSILAQVPRSEAALQQQHGCLTGNRQTCSTATRLEGLIASLSFIRSDEPLYEEEEEGEKADGDVLLLLRDKVIHDVQYGIDFLLQAQHTDMNDGHNMHGAVPNKWPPLGSSSKEDYEVRVDYVQHSLSAVIAYERVFILNQGTLSQHEKEQLQQQHLSKSSQESPYKQHKQRRLGGTTTLHISPAVLGWVSLLSVILITVALVGTKTIRKAKTRRYEL